MKLASSVIALAVCSARYLNGARKFEAFPSGSMRLMSKIFDSQRKAALKRNWYKPVKSRAILSNVYQGLWSDEPNLFAKDGWGFTRGKMTQYKFSFIGETKNCFIGFTHPDYFGYMTQGFGLDTSNGALVGLPPPATVFVKDVGKDSDDVDWFIEYREGGYAEVYMTLNREPLGLAFNISQETVRSFNEVFAGEMRPLLRCKGAMHSQKAIVVTQYHPVVIPSIRPYAARRRPDGRNFELKIHEAKLPEEILQKLENATFPEDYSVRIVIAAGLIRMDVENSIRCKVNFYRDGILIVNKRVCQKTLRSVKGTKGILENYMFNFLRQSNRYKWLPSGGLELSSEELGGSLVFTPRLVFKDATYGLF